MKWIEFTNRKTYNLSFLVFRASPAERKRRSLTIASEDFITGSFPQPGQSVLFL